MSWERKSIFPDQGSKLKWKMPGEQQSTDSPVYVFQGEVQPLFQKLHFGIGFDRVSKYQAPTTIIYTYICIHVLRKWAFNSSGSSSGGDRRRHSCCCPALAVATAAAASAPAAAASVAFWTFQKIARSFDKSRIVSSSITLNHELCKSRLGESIFKASSPPKHWLTFVFNGVVTIVYEI